MAEGTYYAWSPIVYGADVADDGTVNSQKVVNVGEQVDAGKLGVSDEEFQALVDGGSVRTREYPKELIGATNPVSPRQHEAKKAREILEGAQDELRDDPEGKAAKAAKKSGNLEPGTGPSPQAKPAQ